MSFQANYPGECQECGERINPGDQVGYNRDDELVHWPCSAPPSGPEYSMSDFILGPRERLCPKCFTIHAGECF